MFSMVVNCEQNNDLEVFGEGGLVTLCLVLSTITVDALSRMINNSGNRVLRMGSKSVLSIVDHGKL